MNTMSKWLLGMAITLSLGLTPTSSHSFSPQPLIMTKKPWVLQRVKPQIAVPFPTPTPPPPKSDHFKDHAMTPIAAPYYLPGSQNLSSTQTADLALQAWETALNDTTLQPYPCNLQTQLTATATPPATDNQIVQGNLGSNIVALTSINLGQGAMPELKRTWQGYTGSANPTFPVFYNTRAVIALSTSVPFGEKDQLSITRFDLYRVLLHELGHALGLLDDALALSIMNGTLITQGPLTIDLTPGNKVLAGNHNCH